MAGENEASLSPNQAIIETVENLRVNTDMLVSYVGAEKFKAMIHGWETEFGYDPQAVANAAETSAPTTEAVTKAPSGGHFLNSPARVAVRQASGKPTTAMAAIKERAAIATAAALYAQTNPDPYSAKPAPTTQAATKTKPIPPNNGKKGVDYQKMKEAQARLAKLSGVN